MQLTLYMLNLTEPLEEMNSELLTSVPQQLECGEDILSTVQTKYRITDEDKVERLKYLVAI